MLSTRVTSSMTPESTASLLRSASPAAPDDDALSLDELESVCGGLTRAWTASEVAPAVTTPSPAGVESVSGA